MIFGGRRPEDGYDCEEDFDFGEEDFFELERADMLDSLNPFGIAGSTDSTKNLKNKRKSKKNKVRR